MKINGVQYVRRFRACARAVHVLSSVCVCVSVWQNERSERDIRTE